MNTKQNYTEENIKSLNWHEHIRLRPGMYIGKLGNGQASDDGIYVLFKEILDNCIDEYTMGFGKKIEIKLTNEKIKIRDYGRGVPLGKLHDCVAKINTGGKYDTKAFQKSVGLNGVGTKAVNALSSLFRIQAYREGKAKELIFKQGIISKDFPIEQTKEKNGTLVEFVPDNEIFKNYQFLNNFIEEQIWNYVFLNPGLSIYLNNKRFYSRNGLLDLLTRKTDSETLKYPIIHLKGEDIEIAITHNNQYGEEFYSFVNGQYTPQGGTHLSSFKEAIVKTIREFYKKDYDAIDIKTAIVACIAIRIQEPVFESQTKTKLGSQQVCPEGQSIRLFINEFVRKYLNNFLHKNLKIADTLQKLILQSEKERKAIAGIKKIANERAKKANLHNKKLRDCRVHFNDKHELKDDTMVFITEGNSASGSITKSRNILTQAVFSLRGKPLNCFGQTKKIVYENEEFNLLQHALDIENGIENLRYRKIIIATDADVDGMHIRLLILTYFLKFFPDIVRLGHIYILETPLFRVRNKKTTKYCYSIKEKNLAIESIKGETEVTRFKGLGEISPYELKGFIGEDIKLIPVLLHEDTHIKQLLSFYMGKNTLDRQKFIIENLIIEG